MLSVIVVISLILIGLFGFVLLFGAPYLPTLKKQQTAALRLLDLKPGQTLVELGSGDGRLLVEAAKQGINVIGYELNPLLFVYSWLITRRYKTLVSVRLRNFWSVKLPKCDGVYVFLLDKYMNKLDKKITQEKHSSLKLVSFAFELPNRKHVKELSGMYLYEFTTKN